jgi:hypothetical protein
MNYRGGVIMNSATTLHRKPNLLVLAAVFIGLGVLAADVAQADPSDGRTGAGLEGSEKWWRSIWGLDLARKLKDWRPRITIQKDAEGLNLARPFGKSGPTLQFTSALPDSVLYSLRAGGDHQVGAFGNNTDLFLFLQKRW